MVPRAISAALACLLLGVAESASSQTESPAPPQVPPVRPSPSRPFGEIRFGALTLTPALALRDVGIDTNVFDTVDHRSADFTATVAPGASFVFDIPVTRVEAVGDVGFVYYSAFKTERAINRSGSARIDVRLLRRLRIFGTAALVNTKSRLGGEIDARARREITSAGAGIVVGVGRKLEIELGQRHSRTSFADDAVFVGVPLNETLDRRLDQVTAEIRHKLTPKTTVALTALGGQERYPRFSVKDVDVFQLSASGAFTRRAAVSGTASVGFQQTRPLHAETPPFKGVVADLSLVRGLTVGSEVRVLLNRAVSTSFDPASPYFIQNSLGLALRRHLIKRVEWFVSGERQNRQYRSFVGAEAGGGEDTVYVWASTVRAQVTRRTQASWYTESRQRSSNRSSLYGYGGFRSGFVVSYGILTVGNRVEAGGFAPW